MALNLSLKNTSRLILLYMLVGVVAGIGAIIFQQLISLANIFIMEGIVGYTDIKIVKGIRRFELPWEVPMFRIWLFPVIAGFGGLITGLIVNKYAPEAAGHGTDEVIDSYHHHNGEIRLRVSIVKMIASAITLGTGGSGGKEGPIAQIGAGFGSFICSRILFLKKYRREIMLSGMAAGIAAIFRAPLAGAIFAAEILHSDMEYDGKVMIPAVLASVVSFGVYALYFGSDPVFVVPEFVYEFCLSHLFPFTILAVVAAICAIIFVKVFYGFRDCFDRLKTKPYIKPALGGVATGLVCIVFPEAFGEGSFHLQRIIDQAMNVEFLTLLIFLKMLTTSFSIGSGGSGGIFGPSLFIGAALGGAMGMFILKAMPWLDISPVVFVLMGMVAFFAGAANAPVSTVVIVSEMTGVFNLIVPFLWVSIIGYIFSQNWNIYENQKTLAKNILETDGTESIHNYDPHGTREIL